jgi:uncharacterized protein
MTDPVIEPKADDTNMWAMFIHLSALSGLIGVPFGHVAGPLVLWLIKRDGSEILDAHGKEALNFQISSYIYGIAAAILILVLVGIVLLPLVLLGNLILTIVGAIKANNGELYRYPLTIRFFK